MKTRLPLSALPFWASAANAKTTSSAESLFTCHSLPRLRDRVDEIGFATLDHFDPTPDCRRKIFRIVQRSFRAHTHALRKLGVVDLRVVDLRADVDTIDTAAAMRGGALNL